MSAVRSVIRGTGGAGGGCTPGSVITDSVSSTEFGYNLGAAITFELENDWLIYLEAKYHWVDTKVSAKFMPISIGYRW